MIPVGDGSGVAPLFTFVAGLTFGWGLRAVQGRIQDEFRRKAVDTYEIIVRATWDATLPMREPMHRGIHLSTALMSEAGEVGELLKKAHRIDLSCEVVDHEKLMDELGDVLWAVTSLAIWAGRDLDDVKMANVVKLRKRHAQLTNPVEEKPTQAFITGSIGRVE